LIEFILNNRPIKTSKPKGLPLLDFIRYEQQLTGTKIGCREGDCGACSVLVGELENGQVVYRAATSCLMAIGNAHGKHIVTIEGINLNGLNFLQQAFVNEGASQCGFCTPGFMMALTGYVLQTGNPNYQDAIDAVNGNICRCTGYKAIERAIQSIVDRLASRTTSAVEFAIANDFIPAYFEEIPNRLQQLHDALPHRILQPAQMKRFLGGGTDLYVQQHEEMVHSEIDFLFDKSHLNGIDQKGNVCYLGAATTVTDIAESPIFQQHFPALKSYIQLVSSTPIRNMATIAGNLVNASPIGDFTIFFLALNATLVLSDGSQSREVALQKFYKGYKQIDKQPHEHIEKIYFQLPDATANFNFEKVCKRTHLDIASVNSACLIRMEAEVIVEAHLSAGGVGPVPAFLKDASASLVGKSISPELIQQVIRIAQEEIAPISDVRGTEAYKRLLLSQLIKAHFLKLFPQLKTERVLSIHA
jgi:xanthine dehydrogenase small subunit